MVHLQTLKALNTTVDSGPLEPRSSSLQQSAMSVCGKRSLRVETVRVSWVSTIEEIYGSCGLGLGGFADDLNP